MQGLSRSVTRTIFASLAVVAAAGLAWIVVPRFLAPDYAPIPADCETGSLAPGKDGLNVFVYRLCPKKLSLGFANSEVIEELSCNERGVVELWLLIDAARCGPRFTAPIGTTELLEPFKSLGRSTGSPVRQLLTCSVGLFGKAALVVPDAGDAILATRTGDTEYEVLSRRFRHACLKGES